MIEDEIRAIVREELSKLLGDKPAVAGGGGNWVKTSVAVKRLKGIYSRAQLFQRLNSGQLEEDIHYRNIGSPSSLRPSYEWNIDGLIRHCQSGGTPQRHRR